MIHTHIDPHRLTEGVEPSGTVDGEGVHVSCGLPLISNNLPKDYGPVGFLFVKTTYWFAPG